MVRQARALDTLLAEVNRHAPHRDKASDGGLGDPAHAARISDHNPNGAGVWRARDFTDDPPELDGSDLFHRLKTKFGKHPAMMSGSVLIHNRQIISYDRLAEGLRPYDGANPHTTHVHVSVSTASSGYDSTAAWNLWATPAPKPVVAAPVLPTFADCVIALKRAIADPDNTNDRAKADYEKAWILLDAIASGNRVRVPATVAGVRSVLRDHLDRDELSPGQRRTANAAYDLIRGI